MDNLKKNHKIIIYYILDRSLDHKNAEGYGRYSAAKETINQLIKGRRNLKKEF